MNAIFPSSRPNIAVRAIPKIPATLTGAGGIGVSKVNGQWTIEPKWDDLALIAPGILLDPTSKELWVHDPVTGVYNRMTLGGLGQALFWGSSTSSVLIGTGTKTFETQSGKDWLPGMFVQAFNPASITNFVIGQVTAYTGTTLTINVQAIGGSGSHSNWIIVQSTLPGAGPPGATGQSAGLNYNFVTGIIGDPGSGNVGFNSAAIPAITEIRIHDVDRNGVNLLSEIATWDDSTTTAARAKIQVWSTNAPAKFIIATINGPLVDSGAYTTIPVTLPVGATVPDAGPCQVEVFRTGDVGLQGPQGVPGNGASISDGPPGSPFHGMQWFESDTGNMYIYYNDGTSAQWIHTNGAVTDILEEAPIDGVAYARQDAGWVPTTASDQPVSATDFAGVDRTGVADSTVGLQAWINSIYANGKAGRLPAGSYKHTGLTCVGNGSALVIHGDGQYLTKLINTNATSSDITLNTTTLGMNNTHISGISFEPSVAKTAGYAIEQIGDTGLWGSTIAELVIGSNAWGGIKITSCLDLAIRDIVIHRIGLNGRGVSLVGTPTGVFPSIGMVNSVFLDNITIKDGVSGGVSGVTTGIYIGDYTFGIHGKNVAVQGGPNHVDYGIWIATTSLLITVSNYIKFENSYADVCIRGALRIDGSTDVAFTDCTFQFSSAGVDCVKINNVSSCGFVNCQVLGSLRNGVGIVGGTQIRIVGCIFYNNGGEGGGSNVYSDIRVDNSVGAGHVLIDACTFGFAGTTPVSKYNVEVVGPSNTNYVIGLNSYGNFITAAVFDGGTVGANAGQTFRFPKAINLSATGTIITSGTYVLPVVSNPVIQGATLSNGVTVTSPPASFWGLDFAGASMVVNNNATGSFPAGSGLIILTDISVTGTTAMYLVGSAAVRLIMQTGTVYVAGPPAAGQIGIEWDGGSAYRINNKQGNHITFNIATLRTRTSA